jgi:hypothetical protein
MEIYMTENRIKDLNDDPIRLEEYFRNNKTAFIKDLYEIETDDSELVRYWKARIEYKKQLFIREKPIKHEVIATLFISAILLLLALIPAMIGLRHSGAFFEKNLALISLSGLLLAVFYKNKTKLLPIIILGLITAGLVVYISYIPMSMNQNISTLIKLHLPLLLWFIWGFSYIGFERKSLEKRNDFINLNGNMVVMSIVILLGMLAVVLLTQAMFSLIGIDIEKVIEHYILFWIIAITPVIAFVVTENYPEVTCKVIPLLAKIFSPITLITLTVYLTLLPFSSLNLYEDRDSLLIFNLMLFLVMAIMVYGLLDTDSLKSRFYKFVYLFLGIVAFVINVIALSAIFYRVNEFGLSPNRLAVLGSNLLIATHIALIVLSVLKVIRGKAKIDFALKSVSVFLPVYLIWVIIVVFSFPVMF